MAVQSAGINFSDILMAQGLYQDKREPPFIPGNHLKCVCNFSSIFYADT